MAEQKDESMEDIISDFVRFYILTILFEGPVHGYGILNKFKKRIGRKVSPSLVYPFLQRLEEKGLVTFSVRAVGEKEKKVFELTGEGKVFCAGLFRRFSGLISVAIEPSLVICAHCGCKIFEGGYREVIEGKELAFCCTHCAGSFKQEKRLAKHGSRSVS
jgi:Fe2+ or Zn2+ uptake regulation protein